MCLVPFSSKKKNEKFWMQASLGTEVKSVVGNSVAAISIYGAPAFAFRQPPPPSWLTDWKGFPANVRHPLSTAVVRPNPGSSWIFFHSALVVKYFSLRRPPRWHEHENQMAFGPICCLHFYVIIPESIWIFDLRAAAATYLSAIS